jgi:adenylate kinase family enzyme
MNISENILKHSLKNVYFLAGTPCGGKTTMANELSKKYGFIHFNDNWHEDNFKIWQSIIDEKYQKSAAKRESITDWEAYFSRSVEEFLCDKGNNNDYLEFALIELIKLSQSNKVIADICVPLELLAEISDYNRVACLLAPPELVIRDYYGREDHREFIECIMSLKEPEKKLKTQNELFRIGVQETFDDVKKYNHFHIVRDNDSTIETTLLMLEKHFHL